MRFRVSWSLTSRPKALVANCIFAPLILRERFKLRELAAMGLAILGAVTVVYASNDSNPRVRLFANRTPERHIIYRLLTVTARPGAAASRDAADPFSRLLRDQRRTDRPSDAFVPLASFRAPLHRDRCWGMRPLWRVHSSVDKGAIQPAEQRVSRRLQGTGDVGSGCGVDRDQHHAGQVPQQGAHAVPEQGRSARSSNHRV